MGLQCRLTLIFIIKSVGYELMTSLINNIKSKVFQCQRLMPCVRDLAVLPGLSLPVPLLSASFCMRLSTEVFSMFFTNSSWTLKIIKHKKTLDALIQYVHCDNIAKSI